MKCNEKLVLHSYLLTLFGVGSFEKLAKNPKDFRLEELDENGNALFEHKIVHKVTSINPSVDLYKGEIVKINVPIFSYLSNFRPIWEKLLKITQIWAKKMCGHPALRESLFLPKGINRGSHNILKKEGLNIS